ncbi:MAG: hypothetical protein RLZZ324_642 [Candidatus Parcubacteria bacterium]|jgi:hypothetical protein
MEKPSHILLDGTPDWRDQMSCSRLLGVAMVPLVAVVVLVAGAVFH